MRTGLYKMSELFSNRHIEQLVIPEIQRDYVWKEENVGHLLTSILESFRAWKAAPSFKVVAEEQGAGVALDEVELQCLGREFSTFRALRTCATNIGFVYAYCDGDLAGQYFLIDGQQRLTTIYLALLAAAVSKKELIERFRARYCLPLGSANKGAAPISTKVDYRLREHTAEFLHHFVQYFLDHRGTTGQLKEQSWYLSRFDGDKTIKNLIGNFSIIQARLEKEVSPDYTGDLFEYLEDLVECWYFDTNESTQGEELYLYLNARGEAIANNENRKAQLLSAIGDPTQKDVWGREWEGWQDYFWIRRPYGLKKGEDNPNADRGFNSFLSSIENLEKLRNKGGVSSAIDLQTIEKYIKALRWLEEGKDPFKNLYSYSGWVDLWFSEVWGILNQSDPDSWNDGVNATVQKRKVLVWGSLLSVVCAAEDKNCDWHELDREVIFRAIRVFYLRYHNSRTTVASLPDTVRDILNENPEVWARGKETSKETSEELAKWEFLRDRPGDERRDVEAVIWKIEDHPLNLDGSEVGATNLTHLIDLIRDDTCLSKMQHVRDTFYGLFDSEKILREKSDDNAKKVAAALLYFGAFWHQVSPWTYQNYHLGDWRRTIRGQGNKETRVTGNRTVFRRFFEEFLQAGQTLDEFLEQKKGSMPVDPTNERDLRNALIWYSERIGKRLFAEGMYIANRINIENEVDAYFPNIRTLSNTHGTFKGYSNTKLADLVERRSSD